MPIYTLEKLINAEADIIENYNNARQIWDEIKESHSFVSVDNLAQELTDRQFEFEQKCGGRYIGQEIMALVGIGQFYSIEIGFGEKQDDAIKVKDAFDLSGCSLEVKWHAEEAVKIYDLTNKQ